MNRFESVTKPLRWLMALLLVAFVAGCGGGGDGSSAKAITAYSLAGVTGTINETAKTIAVTIPYGTNVTALVATFTTTGSSVKVGTTIQTSGTTANNFTNPVAYTVTAGDSSTATYTVTVTVALNSAKAITAYSLAGVTGTINETAKTIAVTVPYGTNVTALVATFTTTGSSVKVGTTVQTSGTTANNFTSPVAYTVTAGDSSTAAYIVTVTVALNSAKAITAYSLAGVTGTINGTAITVTMPSGTNVTSLIATFTTTGASVKVGTTAQTSATTANDFTSPVVYTVTAADSSTATYTVTVTVALSSAKAITAYSLAGVTGTINGTAITVTMPSGTDVTSLIATFTTTGASVKVGTTAQTSATTPNDFTNPVAYTVTAADSSTATYTVTVTVATGPAAVDLLSISANNFVILSASPTTGITDTGAHTSAITGNIGLSPASAAAIGVWCSEMTGNIYGADVAYVGDGLDVTCFKGLSADNTLVGNAVLDIVNTVYPDAAGRAHGTDAAHLNVGTGTLTGQNFAPGTYTWDTPGDVNITGNITLTGGASDVWIFQMTGNLSVASCASCASASDAAGIKVMLSGGAQASNVFWQVGGGTGATLGTYSTFNGNILSATQVVMQTGAVLHGRALAQTAVILDANPVGP